jgi:hypothetical protein
MEVWGDGSTREGRGKEMMLVGESLEVNYICTCEDSITNTA